MIASETIYKFFLQTLYKEGNYLQGMYEAAEYKNTIIKVREPWSDKLLFYRSDNLPFAEKGIPAHSFMTSDDDDPCYHQPCDDLIRIDIDHLAGIVKAIALITVPIVSVKFTPKKIRFTP